jgi:hypothetical protein
MTTSLPSSPLPRSITRVAWGANGVPIVMVLEGFTDAGLRIIDYFQLE